MSDYTMISSDSHVSEPLDLWVERIEKTYQDRAPQLVINPPGRDGAFMRYEGLPLHSFGIGVAAGKSPKELKDFLVGGTYGDARPGGWDPAERIKDNELDGVEADVIYTTLGFRLFWLKDAGLQQACFRVYNDWLAEYCSYAPKKMAGLGLISLYDPNEGVRELQRCASLGLKGAMIWCSPPGDQPYSLDIYDPFWAEAQELNMPISMHAVTGMGRESQEQTGPHVHFMRSITITHEIEQSLSVLIFSGVLERFPNLKIVSAENNCGWIPYSLQKMDRVFDRGRWASESALSLKPSEYFRRQIFCTYIDDFVGVSTRHLISVDNLMWSSDYPHAASSWPHSQEVVARDFGDASAEDRYKMTRGNVAELYGFDL